MHWTAWEIRKSLYIVNTPIWKPVVVSDDHGGDDDNEDANMDDKKADEERMTMTAMITR